MEKSKDRKSDSTHIANKKPALKAVGEFLREARQGRNLSIEDISSSLRIGKEQLIALEEGDENLLPERVFIRAMVRRIAEKLNLDTSFIFEELNKNEKNEPKPAPVRKKENPKRIKSFNALSIVLLSGALGLFSSIMLLKYIDRTQNDSIDAQKSELLLDNNYYF